MNSSPMVRPRTRLIGGVCAGFAEHTGWPLGLVRLLAVILAFAGGAGLALYAWLWLTTPVQVGERAPRAATFLQQADPEASPDATNKTGHDSVPTRQRASAAPVTEILLGLALLVLAGALVASRMGVDIPLAVIIPAAILCAGVGLAWHQLDVMRRGATKTASIGGPADAAGDGRPGGVPGWTGSSGALIRTLGALVLVALGILLFFVTGQEPNVWTVVIAAFSVLLGVALVLLPWLVRLNRDLAEERAARARENERAEIAAHLHDSVLQSLALIQQKSDTHSDVAKIARSQERELRAWLFGDGATVDSPEFEPAVDLPAALRATAVAFEADFPVVYDVVVVGREPWPESDAIVAAAREAMLNAARHAGGTVSVFLEGGAPEGSGRALDISVVDRGPGFDPGEVPPDRHGVRESIAGRMERAGGTARIGAGPGGKGTEVRLHLPAGSATQPVTGG